jgi:hypothetical protein
LLKNVNLNSKEDETSQDYIFRYRLDLESEKTPIFHHRLAELVRTVLESLLDVIVPLKVGEDVKVDGFRWLMDREQVYQLFSQTGSSSVSSASGFAKEEHSLSSKASGPNITFQSIANAAFYEPRIDLIKRLAESLLTLIEFGYEGEPVKVDSFRLQNLQDWLVASAGDPSEIFEYAGSHCSCDCIFCCNRGNPSSVATSSNLSRTPDEEFAEIKTRVKYFSPEARKALFPSLGCVYEVTTHPYFMDVLGLLREKTSKPFRITTSGCNLTPEVVARLAKLKPVYLYLSLNSTLPSRRRKLMRDSSPEVAINALPLLRQHAIPYAVVIVPWPVGTLNEMLDDLSSTVAYATEHEAHLVQVNLPGYSKHFSSVELFDLDQVWKEVIAKVRELREKYDCPIVAMPTLYEENTYHRRKNLPQVIGLVKNSPGYLGGLKRGDVIKQINGIPVRDRPQARDLLALVQRSGAKEASVKVQRGRQTFELNLNLARYSYPYSEDIDIYLGIIFTGTGLRMSYIETLKEVIEPRQAKQVLFLSSELIKPTFEQCLTESRLFMDGQLKIDIEVPKNNFFGGNIFMGDLLVVQDFIDYIKGYIIRKGRKPDLVVIPLSPFNLSGWGRDLTGRVYLDIERETGVPVELLPCATIYD